MIYAFFVSFGCLLAGIYAPGKKNLDIKLCVCVCVTNMYKKVFLLG